MSAQGVVDLSFTPGEEQELADLPFDVSLLSGNAPEAIHELIISHAQISRLTSVPNAQINDIVPYVTTLRASHNDISTLQGLEAFVALEVLDLSHNCLRFVDAHAAGVLRTLRHLRTVDLSYNRMRLLDLDGSVGAPSPKAGGSNLASSLYGGPGGRSGSASEGFKGLLALTAVNLGHNSFIELPDLRSAPFLQVLDVSHNRLESLLDVDSKLPLVALHTLLLHSNQLSSVASLTPLCALATTLAHVQVFDNLFTFHHHNPVEGMDEDLWWRPFLLWLCPMLISVDQTELTPSERELAMETLFREHGTLSRAKMEQLNAVNRDGLASYLRREARTASPPGDAVAVIEELRADEAAVHRRDDHDAATPHVPTTHLTKGETDEEEGEEEEDEVLVQMSRMHRRQTDIPPTDSVGVRDDPALVVVQEDGQASKSKARTSALLRHRESVRVVITDPNGASADDVYVRRHNHRLSKSASLSTVVRALQHKTRSLEEVVSVLWRSDLTRRTVAAIRIQRVMRGALARMHLPEEEAESCRFIRYQLQQIAAAQKTRSKSFTSNPYSRGPSTRSAPPHQPPLTEMDATGANMEEVLVSMRSLQEVMGSMWVDLEEYRAMADREQRRAAIIIQRCFRGYCVRRDYGRVWTGRKPQPLSVASVPVASCKCAAKTAALEADVADLRNQVRELRDMLLLQQSNRPQRRLSSHVDPEQAIDDIIRKHEERVSAHERTETNAPPREGSRSPSATPSVAGEESRRSYGKSFTISAGRGDDVDEPQGSSLRNVVVEANSDSTPVVLKKRVVRVQPRHSGRASQPAVAAPAPATTSVAVSSTARSSPASQHSNRSTSRPKMFFNGSSMSMVD